MDRRQVAQVLDEVGTLMELKGENPFKCRAYHNASRTISTLTGDLNALVASGEILNIKGIGAGLADSITELVRTGKLALYVELKDSIPPGLLEMLNIPGLGAKKVKAIHDKLGIATIGELEYACTENRLVDLDGFGAKTQANVLKGIEFRRKFKERHLYPMAEAAAQAVHAIVSRLDSVMRSSVAGSLRRRRETVKDVDIVASARDEDRGGIMQVFTTQAGVDEVLGSGDAKSSIRMESGIQVDLRVVSDDEFPFALMHFTGSAEHNTQMRSLAISQGLKLNEYGLFKGETGIPCADEAAIFRKLGLAYIPPELREAQGELDAAAENALPQLVEEKDIRGILHCHSNYSDGANSIEEMARRCMALGYEYLGICDHSKVVVYAHGLSVDRVKKQHEEIDRLNEELVDFTIFKGTECDILPDGTLDYDDETLATFDFVVASIHSKMSMTADEALQRVGRALANPFVTILGHPTGRLLLSREGYPLDMVAVVDLAARHGKVIELNAHPYRLDIDWRHGKHARDRGVLISINPDSHSVDGLKDMRYGMGAARKGWLAAGDVLNTKSAKDLATFFHRANH